MRKIDLLGIKADSGSKREIVGEIISFAVKGHSKIAFYLNAHCVNLSFRDREYREILNSADLVYPGGKGVVLASRLFRDYFIERTNILDFLVLLETELKERGLKVYLLGSEGAIVKAAEQALGRRGLNVVGAMDGFFSQDKVAEVIRDINLKKPNILIVGMGVPKQEKWIWRNKDRLDVNLLWGVGAAFDWISGYRKRAPKWMVFLCLEWLHRLMQDPRNKGRRYLIGNIEFILRVLRWRFIDGKAIIT